MTMPQPHEVRAAITLKLLATTKLVEMLAMNAPWNDPAGRPAKSNSIVPMDEIEQMTPMYVGIMAGPMVKNERVSYNSFIYMRVYNAIDRDYIGIEKAAAIIAGALDRARLTMDNTLAAQIDLEQILGEATDEALNQKYRELQFRLVLL
jgi:hypothetical protein